MRDRARSRGATGGSRGRRRSTIRRAPLVLSEREFAGFRSLIRELSGIDLAPNKRAMLAARLTHRLDALGLSDYRAYYDLVIVDPQERERMINRVTTNLTSLFREPDHFDFLRDRVIGELRARVAGGAAKRLRLWSAACSTGEEPYSLAMVAHRALAADGYALEIYASDIDTDVLERARDPVYKDAQIARVPPDLRRYLERGEGGWRICDELRSLVRFHPLNLLRDRFPFQGPFDAVFLRNVIIYFDRADQARLFHRLHGYVAKTGYLFLGHSESLLHLATDFTLVGRTIYRPTRRTRRTTARPTAHPPPHPAVNPAPRTKVLVVDDSSLMRDLLAQLLSLAPDIEVIAAVPDPFAAWAQIKARRPDVVTLDVEMPRMDGISFLAKLMRHYPLPVVMVSSLTQAHCETSLRALELGAVDIFAKPELSAVPQMTAAAEELIGKVRAAARARLRAFDPPRDGVKALPVHSGRQVSLSQPRATPNVIAIGASTGGTEAIRALLTEFPPGAPGTVVVQHMPERFTAAFAARLDRLCQICVREARHGDHVLPGHALIAPGGRHMTIVRSGAACTVAIDDTPPVNRHRPSVDVLFHSCARQLGPNAIGVLLTGMGDDGAAGLKAMRDAGAHTIAQDESTSIVFGMPRVAIELGAAAEICALHDIAAAIIDLGGRAGSPISGGGRSSRSG